MGRHSAFPRRGSPTYFLGTLLVVPLDEGVKKVSIIDGQQRITTVSLLLATLRDHCLQYPGLKGRANVIRRLISRVDNDDRPVGPLVVKLQNPDESVYSALVRDPRSTYAVGEQRGLVAEAVKLLLVRVKEHLASKEQDEQGKALRQLCEYVQTNVKFLILELENEAEADLVFDRTNTRGLRLSPSEALKALLATIAREDVSLSIDLMGKWDATAMKLESAGLPIDAMDDYLHAIWCSREGYTSKRNLDKVVAAKTEKLQGFAEDIEPFCNNYLAVVRPQGVSTITEDLRDLRHLNIQANSFLTMVNKINPKRFNEAIDVVLSLQVRNITIGDARPNAYEKEWPKWAQWVREGKLEDAFAAIREHMISDEEFIRQFERFAAPKASTAARHLLRRLDPISRQGSGVQPVEVEVEHVMPKAVATKLLNGKKITSKASKWINALGFEVPGSNEECKELGKQIESYLHKLGNQALLNETANRGAKDSPFDSKKSFYAGQKLELTKELADMEQ